MRACLLCGAKHHAQGLCRRHYDISRRHKNAEALLMQEWEANQCPTISSTTTEPGKSPPALWEPSYDPIPITHVNGHGASLPGENLSPSPDGTQGVDSRMKLTLSRVWKSILDGLFWTALFAITVALAGLGVVLMASLLRKAF